VIILNEAKNLKKRIFIGSWPNGMKFKHGHGLLYTSGELRRLMRLAPPRRAAIAAWMTGLVLADGHKVAGFAVH
jgi:hypothetical protein